MSLVFSYSGAEFSDEHHYLLVCEQEGNITYVLGEAQGEAAIRALRLAKACGATVKTDQQGRLK